MYFTTQILLTWQWAWLALEQIELIRIFRCVYVHLKLVFDQKLEWGTIKYQYLVKYSPHKTSQGVWWIIVLICKSLGNQILTHTVLLISHTDLGFQAIFPTIRDSQKKSKKSQRKVSQISLEKKTLTQIKKNAAFFPQAYSEDM